MSAVKSPNSSGTDRISMTDSKKRPAGKKRLSRSSEFQRVYRQGRSKSNRYLVLYSFARGDDADQGVRFGVSVGRKVGNAVVRNKVKRTIREAYAELSDDLTDGLDYVVLARTDIVELVERDGMRGVKDALSELISAQTGGVAKTTGDDESAGS